MKKYEVGDIITGEVTGIEDYGIFLLIENDVTGLIHISEVSNSFVRNVNDYAEINEKIKAKVIEVDEKTKHLKLSIKDIEYRDSSKYRQKITETENGFSSLGEVLDKWVDDKLQEMEQKK